MSDLHAVLVIIGFFALCVVDVLLKDRFLSEQDKWDLAAGNMQVLGYSDLEIFNELGPRPEDKTK
jgi:hypothetical protein